MTQARLNEDVEYRAEVERFIAERAYEDLPQARVLRTTNRRNTVRVFDFAPAGRALVLKSSTAGPRALAALGLARDYAADGFAGTAALSAAGVPCPRPVACWSAGEGPERVSYFLYEEVASPGSVRDFRRHLPRDPAPAQAARSRALIQGMARVSRRLHDANLRHGSLELGNFLITSEEDDGALVLIDNDRVTRTHLPPGPLKRFFDLSNLCRINLPGPERRLLLEEYLGGPVGPWFAVLQLWRVRHFRPKKWLRRRLRKLRTS